MPVITGNLKFETLRRYFFTDGEREFFATLGDLVQTSQGPGIIINISEDGIGVRIKNGYLAISHLLVYELRYLSWIDELEIEDMP